MVDFSVAWGTPCDPQHGNKTKYEVDGATMFGMVGVPQIESDMMANNTMFILRIGQAT